MKRYLKTPSICLAALLFLAPSAPAQEAPLTGLEDAIIAAAAGARPKTVCVLGLAGSGSGAVIDAKGTTVTNAHVAAGARYAVLLYADGARRLARRRGIDYQNDLAIYELVEPLKEDLPFFEIAEDKPAAGAAVLALGYPGGPKSTPAPTLSFGLVRDGSGPGAVNGFLDYSGALTSDLPIFPGNSGGPMFDTRGLFLGINGAVNLDGSAAYTIPAETVRDRLKRLRRGLALLPGGRSIDTEKNPILRRLFGRFDAFARQVMEPRLRPQTRERRPGLELERALPKAPARKSSDKLARNAQKTERNQRLARDFAETAKVGRACARRLVDDTGAVEAYATVIDGRYAVAVLSRLDPTRAQRFKDGGRAKVVATDPKQNLALLELSRPVDAPKRADAAPPVGSWVLTPGFDQPAAVGVLSVGERAVRARVLGGGMPAPLKRALALAERLAKALRQTEISALLEQMRKSFEMRDSYMRGNAPRSYRKALSHDSPLAPSQIGLPLIDSRGRLLGVNVANAHFGTSYAVSLAELERSFSQLR